MNSRKPIRTITGQLPFGADLYDGVSEIVRKENIRFGRVQAIGATTHAVVAYYDQKLKNYMPLEFDGGMEILNCAGNISIRDGKPFLHIHLILGDRDGKVFGGHVLPGTKIFALEVFIDEYDGEEFIREKDDRTGLFLWKSGTLL